ncbi:arylesterase [Marinigracilibium pacificum]|uniref:Arylesterase n=1 Tax=Marinigracilibium pacificum TaxID=2729599 RepID=A0A848IUZ5_9BACT|nr:arylesterase [Marinigracilibium pacificum]NMM48157.1 arylesterase [Marinigracilibium pacificum]
MIIILIGFITGCAGESSNQKQGKNSEEEKSESEVMEKDKKLSSILFFGNSLTAGLGVGSDESFPSVTGKLLDSLGYKYAIINAGISGETTASGLSRIEWVLDNSHFDIFVLELGANDGLRGIPVNETYRNLTEIIRKVKSSAPHAKILLTGMMVPPNMGPEYSAAFRSVFGRVSEEQNVTLLPFLLENVAGIDSLNQEDGIHPNVKGHRITAENVTRILTEKVL